MSTPNIFEVDDLMDLADAVGVTAGPTSAQPEGKLLIHPSLRDCLTGGLDEVLEAWSFAAAGCYPPDVPIDLVPVDPMDLDRIPPADVDVCTECAGQGDREVLLDGEYFHRLCSWCEGTGERSRP
jgi:hypothetical protein